MMPPKATSKKRKTEKKSISQVFTRARRKARKALQIKDLDELKNVYLSCVKGSFSKCIDFNETINKQKLPEEESYLYIGSLRGLCEDLIVLRYLAQKPPSYRNRFLIALIRRNWSKAISVQKAFFAANNSLQPVLGARIPDQRIARNLERDTKRLQATSMKLGLGKYAKIAEMAQAVGLTATYDYIYYLSSNFVHFNPNALLRMGWSRRKKAEDFEFSIKNMSGYYMNVSRFYGGVLFVGFANFVSKVKTLDIDLKKEIQDVKEAIRSVPRWPEVLTFEEMNVKPPFFLLLHALRDVSLREHPDTKYGEILKELDFAKKVKA